MLRPTFYSFETAKRALASSQMGLDTVGHNISNVNTPGYTRQRVDQVTFNLGQGRWQFRAYGHQFPGQGAEVSGINQIRDPYLDRRFRTEAAKVGELGVASDGLDKLNRIFDEIQKTGSHAKMSEFLTELDALIAGADSPEQATILKSKAQDLARVLNKNSIDLENAAIQQQEEMLSTVDSINVLLEQIADLNVKIKEDHFYGNPSNENNDLRNLYIDQLSELVDIHITKTPIEVAAGITVESVKIGIKGSKPEAVLVDSGLYNGIEARFTNPLKPNKDKHVYEYLDDVSYHLIDGMTKLPILEPGQTEGDGDITKHIMTGALKGHLDMMNGKSIDAEAGENTYRGLPYTQKALDDYAKKLAEVMNGLNAVDVWNPPEPGPPPVDGFFSKISRDLFVASGVTGDATEYLKMGRVEVSPGVYEQQVQATLLDGTEIEASGWRAIDPETGNVLGINSQPILDAGGQPLNVRDFERKLTARNIAVSQAWQEDPLYITRETLNSAIYTGESEPGKGDAGTLKVMNDDGTMTDTGVDYKLIDSIGAGGVLLDADGNPLQYPPGEDLTLGQLQKALTEEAPKPPVIEDFFPVEDLTDPLNPIYGFPTGNLTFKQGTAPLNETQFFVSDGANPPAFSAAAGAFADWSIDKDGNLLDQNGSLVFLSTSVPPSNTAVEKNPYNIKGLVQQVEDATTTDVPPTFEDYFPNGNIGKSLTITEKNPDGTISDHLYEAGDFGPGKYESFDGWSVNPYGELVDAENKLVYPITDIALTTSSFVRQTPPDLLGTGDKIENYLDPDNALAIMYDDGSETGAAYAPGAFGPGSFDADGNVVAYTDFKGWTVDKYGAMRDADGNRVYLNSEMATLAGTPPDPIEIKEDARDSKETGLKQWNFPIAPASIKDFLNADGDLIQRTNTPQPYNMADFRDENGDPIDPADWAELAIDKDGYLTIPTGEAPPKATTQRISIAGDPSRKVNVNDLVQQVFQTYKPGEATPNDLLPGEKANGNLDQMKIALTESRVFPNGFKGNFQEYMIGFQEDMANDKQTNDSLLSGTVNVMTGLADSRDGISAVSIDEEGISMMTYQNYYNAASRYMTTLDEALDKIINGMGVVGR